MKPNLPKASIAGALDWDTVMKSAKSAPCTFLKSNDTLFLLYTSGSTGKPKGIQHGNSYAVGVHFCMDSFMKVEKDEVFFASSDVGWIVGHSFIVYAPLLCGASTILYEGKPVGTPDAAAFWRMIEEYKVNYMFSAPTALRAVRKADPDAAFVKRHNISSLRAFFWAGERGDPETVGFFTKHLSAQAGKEVPIVDSYFQTEVAWPVCGIQDSKKGVLPGSTAKPLPGYDLQILEEVEGSVKTLKDNEQGMICLKLPLPPGGLLNVYHNEERYLSAYMKQHPGYYNTGDLGFRDSDGYITIMSRNDDIINVAGHR
jgi:propionyl-CoA synthetase